MRVDAYARICERLEASVEWYPWYPIDFRRDTLRLSFAEDGAYRRLIDEYMILRGPLPDDDIALARILGVGLEEWLSVAAVVRRYFRSDGSKLHHKRCQAEIAAQDRRTKRFSERGKKAAFAKYSKVSVLGPRRILLPPTRQDIRSLEESQSGATPVDNVDKPQAAFEKVRVSSPHLEAIVRGKLK